MYYKKKNRSKNSTNLQRKNRNYSNGDIVTQTSEMK